jgi:hypothetical protein
MLTTIRPRGVRHVSGSPRSAGFGYADNCSDPRTPEIVTEIVTGKV